MNESDLIPFTMWAVISGLIISISALSYRAYMRKIKNETSTS